jgi:hypothetical protein
VKSEKNSTPLSIVTNYEIKYAAALVLLLIFSIQPSYKISAILSEQQLDKS